MSAILPTTIPFDQAFSVFPSRELALYGRDEETIAQSFSVNSRRGRAFTVQGIRSEHAGLTASASAAETSQQHVVRLQFVPTSNWEERVRCTLRLVMADTRATEEIPLVVTYRPGGASE